MSPLREALVLPCVFLTVALLGGVRFGPDVRLLPPSAGALVLAVLAVGALARSRVLVVERFLHRARSPLENFSGAVVLMTLVAAAAQAFSVVTPDTGLLHVIVSVFFAVQLLTTLAGVRDRLAMLRSNTVLLGCAYVLRYVALEALYAPGRGVMKRVMTALLEGVTLGGVEYVPAGEATAYVAFAALALFVAGLVMLDAPADLAQGTVRSSAGRGTDLTVVDATGVEPSPRVWHPAEPD
jgi:hypothetical protein